MRHTACKDCRHMLVGGRSGDKPKWYHYTCGGATPNQVFNPVEGVFEMEGLSFCRDINTGVCPFFKSKELAS